MSYWSPEVAARKESIVDVLVRAQNGTRFIVEMQVAKMEGFEKRAQYYAAKTYCSHFKTGEKYADLTKVVFLAITDYIVFPKKDSYRSDHVVMDNKTFENDLKDFSFTFVELPKFTKENHEVKAIEEKWYYFFKHADESNNINDIIASHPEIREAYSILDRCHWTEEEFHWYEKIAMDYADAQGIMDAAVKDAKEEGRQEGKEERRQEGKEEGKHDVASNMLKQGFSLEQVASATGLSEKEVGKLSRTKS